MMLLEDVQYEIQRQMDRDWAGKDPRDIVELCYDGLAEEVGEVCGLRKRELRNLPKDRERCTREHFVEELGDVLWYLVAVCNLKGITLDELWNYNCDKLGARYGE